MEKNGRLLSIRIIHLLVVVEKTNGGTKPAHRVETSLPVYCISAISIAGSAKAHRHRPATMNGQAQSF
jgi:hypothetical protein